jgi:hypothetical protein
VDTYPRSLITSADHEQSDGRIFEVDLLSHPFPADGTATGP